MSIGYNYIYNVPISLLFTEEEIICLFGYIHNKYKENSVWDLEEKEKLERIELAGFAIQTVFGD